MVYQKIPKIPRLCLSVACYVSLWLRTTPRTPLRDFHHSYIIISFESLVDSSSTPCYFIVISHVPKTLVQGIMDMDNLHINKYNLLFGIILILFLQDIKLIPKFIHLPYLHGINVFLKFNLLQLSILHLRGPYHSACFLEHCLTPDTSATSSRHKPLVYLSPSQHLASTW